MTFRIFSNLRDSMILLAVPIRPGNIHLEGICSVKREKQVLYDSTVHIEKLRNT